MAHGGRRSLPGWYGGAAGRAAVATRQAGGSGRCDKLTVDTIDLDRDGAADFLIFAGVEPVGPRRIQSGARVYLTSRGMQQSAEEHRFREYLEHLLESGERCRLREIQPHCEDANHGGGEHQRPRGA